MKLEISASQLSFGLQGDDVARVHQAIQALGRDLPADEVERCVFGSGTVAALKALQSDSGVPATGVIDVGTIRVLNDALTTFTTGPRTVRGQVSDPNGNPATGLSVQLYLQDPSGETVIGESPLDAGGAYAISYRLPDHAARVDLRIEARDAAGAVETTPPGTSIVPDAGLLEVVNFALSGGAHLPGAEFDLLLADVKPLLGSRDPGTLKEDAENHQASLLAVRSGRPSAQVATFALANRLAAETDVPVAVLYGLLREGLPADVAALQATHPDLKRAALQAAVSKGTVPATIDGRSLESFLPGLTPVPDDRLNRLLGRALQPAEINRFFGEYLTSGEDPAVFWHRIAADPALGGRAGALKLAVQTAGLTDNHEPLTAAILARSDVKQASDLARLTEADWTALIQASGVPGDASGANPDERSRNYVQQILTRVEAAFPTQFFAARLASSPIGRFLEQNPSYDLTRTYPTLFFKQNPSAAQALDAGKQRQLHAFQRVHRLTGRAQETIALAARGVESAQQIARASRQVFVDRHHDILPSGLAGDVYDRALRTSAIALALVGEHAAAMNRTGIQALPRLDTAKQAALAANNPIPDWQTLFGSMDSCACAECGSVHGAAAYFVDALHFLDDRGALAPLLARRPDLADVELSCENTNTPLPFVDLVNEVLEDAVAAPAPFVPLDLPPAIEADLAQTIATDALSAAFNPPLATGARVELVAPGRRWRIWDQRFAYLLVKDTAPIRVVARSRQTRGSAAELRATPQYRNSDAYGELARSVYPWNLPFDLPGAEAKAFLEHLGTPRPALIEALRPLPEPFDPNAPVIVRLAAERIGLTDLERTIIVGEPLVPPRPAEAFWGSAPPADLGTVRALLDRSGLTYPDLEALLATRFINPGGAVTITPDPGSPDACDTTTLLVNGLTADVLGRLHRFVRLWRKAGWTIRDLDRAICAFASDPLAPALTNLTLVRLDHVRALGSTLRLSFAQTLALWKPIDTAEPGSLYASLFDNPAVFKSQDEDFRLGPDGSELLHTDKSLVDHAAALQAAFRLDSTSFALLVAKTNGTLNLANLSLINRHTSLARQLRLTIQNLLTAIELIGIDPFRADRTEATLRFVETVAAIRGSAFDIPQLDYLLRHRFNPASSFVPAESSLAQILTDVRASLRNVGAPDDADTVALQHSAIIDRVAAAVGLPADVAGHLLATLVHSGTPAIQRFAELSALADIDTLSRDNARVQFEMLEKLLKIGSVIQALGLTGGQLHWLFQENPWLADAPDPAAAPVSLASWFSLIQLDRLRQQLSLGDAAREAILGAIAAVAAAADQPARLKAKRAFVAALSTWLGWTPADLTTLVGDPNDLVDLGLLKARLPEDYRIDLVGRLSRAMALIKRLGATAAQANLWCEATLDEGQARAIRATAKAKYDDDAWQRIAVPLQDSLRERQRDALVGYLVARPDTWTTGLATANAADLYAHFLIDVAMSACQLTSRLKQAIGSTQLFAQRCLMGLEAAVQPADPAWQRWTAWMKNFRVWEANRKIWLYPENWIDPDLRDDKSPFFKELENELLQSDLNNAAAEQALMHYLEKLDEVSHLEIAGTYEDEDKTLHVFARTFHAPRAYFYRRRPGATLSWTPWLKVELDIEGDHLVPVVWNRKLMLIWPIFTEKQVQTRMKMPAAHENLGAGKRYWEIQLAWSEFQYGRWSGIKLSEPVKFDAILGEPNILFGEYVPPPAVVMARQNTGTTDPPPVTPPTPPSPGGTGTASEGDQRLVPQDLVTFKAFVSPDVMTVRGYLRLDYSGSGAGAAFAYPFGEFRFSGCRKMVTAAYGSQMVSRTFALAPQGAEFEAMWFARSGSGFTMLDGTFPPPRGGTVGTVFDNTNEPAPLPQVPSAVTDARIDVPVLGRAPSAYRLLPPHQDPQFLGDRPFFFMDDSRAFVVSSTGHSGFVVNPATWAVGDLATVGIASDPSPQDGGSPQPPRGRVGGLTLLLPGPGATRMARTLTAFDLSPSPPARRLISRFWSARAYTFKNFHHAYVCEFVRSLDRAGISALLSLDSQSSTDSHSFDIYAPTSHVQEERPVDEVDFHAAGAYALYNWELFFHIPLLMATRLSRNQRFAEAQRWFHYIFDPTGASGGEVPRRYWRTKPFNDRLSQDYEQESVEAIERLAAEGAPEDLVAAVNIWRDDPFSPFAVARLRTTAFQKTVVMKYLDNLIAWGDQLFRGDTIETINEATQLYVLAAEILGRRPETISARVQPAVQTFNSLSQLGLLSNSLEQIELLVPHPGDGGSGDDGIVTVDPPKMLYFCVQENDRLAGYWDTVADRLFKIRHCMNIEGQVRQLPLFEPPIDPGLLVRARAAGLSVADVMSDIQAPLPSHRFNVIVQKANELASEVRNFGAQLLSALEKRDAEALSTLRSGQEAQLLKAVRDVRLRQLDDANANQAALEKSREIVERRKEYYESRDFISGFESAAMALFAAALSPLAVKVAAESIAAISHILPIFKVGSPTTAGTEYGGENKGKSSEAVGRQQETAATVLNISSLIANRLAEYTRRKDEWDHQADLAAIELKQIDQQLAAGQIRVAMAERELTAHDQQIDHARATDEFLRGKFTNQELFQWMIGELSALYFQSYQLAYDLAKRAEGCMQHELGLTVGETSIIRFGDWDSLKKGLLAGERLGYDLKRLEVAWLDGSVREYELIKHISLVSLAPEQLVALKDTGACEFDVPEWLFDLDTPGHYRRRIKMVGVTIPCVIGPYTTIHCKVQLTKSSYRQGVDLTPGYARLPADDPGGPDTRFVDVRAVANAMVTSTAQNDTGVFEPSIRDERYLPFEGAGAISRWRLELPAEFRTFDYDTIADVILHVRYTAKDSESLRGAAIASVNELLADAADRPLVRLFSLRHEFPTEWHRFVNAPAALMTTMRLDLTAQRFPYFAQGREIAIHNAKVTGRSKSGLPVPMVLAPGQTPPDPGNSEFVGSQLLGPWTIGTTADPRSLEDALLIVAYTI